MSSLQIQLGVDEGVLVQYSVASNFSVIFLNHVLETIIKDFDGRKAVASYMILFQDKSDEEN